MSNKISPTMIKLGNSTVHKRQHPDFADADPDDDLVESSSTNPPNVYGFGHEGYYRNVLAVLRGEARPETDGRAGRKSLELYDRNPAFPFLSHQSARSADLFAKFTY